MPGENDVAGLAGIGSLDELLFDRRDQRFRAVPEARVDFECLTSPLFGQPFGRSLGRAVSL